MNAYETINDILVHLFNEIWELEEKAIITEEYKDISNNDMRNRIRQRQQHVCDCKKAQYYSWLSDNFYEQLGQ